MSKQLDTPKFTSISPINIGLEGGEFTISGTDLNNANLVDFKLNGKSIQGITNLQVTDKSIKGKILSLPSTVSGDVLDVFVDFKGIPTNSNLKMNVKGPTLTAVSPHQGPVVGDTKVTLTGNYLTGTSEVLFGSIPGTDLKVINDTTVTVVSPKASDQGSVNVSIKVQGLKSNVLSYQYNLESNLPMTIDVTSAGLPTGTPVYLYVVGEVKLTDTKEFYRLDPKGIPQKMALIDNSIPKNTFPGSDDLSTASKNALQENYPFDWADYSIPVGNDGTITINLANINGVNIPGLGTGEQAFSGRIYLSVGVPRVPFIVHNEGYTQPTFHKGMGHYTLFDWIEFSFDSLQNFNANTTMVDQFGLSLTLSAVSSKTTDQGQITKVGLKTGTSRNDLIEVESALFAEGRVIVPPVTMEKPPTGKKTAYPANINFNVGGILRVCSPDTIMNHSSINAGLKNYFDGVIDQWYSVWQRTPLVVTDSNTGTYSGVVVGDQLTFKEGRLSLTQWSAQSDVAFTFAQKITTKDIWQCNGVLATGSPASKNAGKVIAAAFNRGVISSDLTDVDCKVNAAGFYPSGGTYNRWSSLAHQYSLHGLAYGFAYDDVCDQNPTVALESPTSINITLESF